MPATYAHYVFGNRVLEELPETLRKRLDAHASLYETGLHGPDVLYFYRPIVKNRVLRIGHAQHAKPAADFLEPALSTVTPQDEAGLAYLSGFICHFTLDHLCHPYIEGQIRKTGRSHAEMEVAFDRLMNRRYAESYPPSRLVERLTLTEKEAERVVTFYDGVTAKQFREAVHTMRFCYGFLVKAGPHRRRLIRAALHLAGKSEKMAGLFEPFTPDAVCARICDEMSELFEEGVRLAARLVEEYWRAASSGNRELDEVYRHNFK